MKAPPLLYENPAELLARLRTIAAAKCDALENARLVHSAIAKELQRAGVYPRLGKSRAAHPLLDPFIRTGQLIKDLSADVSAIEDEMGRAEVARKLKRDEMLRDPAHQRRLPPPMRDT